MKKYIFALLFIFLTTISYGEEFLDAPVMPDSQIVKKEDGRLTYTTGRTHDEILSFYREKLESLYLEKKESPEDINYRDWKDVTYIEDDGRMPWHSITISKEMSEGKTTVVISKDRWTWIMGTLILRFVAVFIVLLVLFVGMKVSGAIISSTVNKAEAKKT